ncbi:MAG: type II toxin-antitoxin system death-on-curing family toxin [Pseudomonadota bacterium]
MRHWIWLKQEVILAVHEVQLAEHGGGAGVRDVNLFLSAMARPENLAVYGKPDAAELAAAYGYGLSRNHAFIDGNKRTGYVAAELFLELNGFSLTAQDADAAITMLAVSAGDITEKDFASWLRMHLVELTA